MNLPKNSDIRVEELTPGYPVIHIANTHATASIALHGAHLTHYAPLGEAPVIFTSQSAIYTAGKAIRGGIPICWPWFGAHPAPNSGNFPAHGYARTSFWELENTSSSSKGTRLIFTLPPPYNSPLRASLEILIGKTLELSLTTVNQSATPQTFSEALHSYFTVTDAHTTELLGLNGRDYINSATAPETREQQSGPVHFPNEIDRIYTSTDGLTICDHEKNRCISIKKTNSRSSIVWNPGPIKGTALNDLHNDEIAQFICAESGNVREESITLPPQSSHTLTLNISTSPCD